MDRIIEFVRDHIFLILFCSYWVYYFVRKKIKRPKYLAINAVNYIESIFLAGDVKLALANANDFLDIMVTRYEELEKDFEPLGFIHLCDFQNLSFNQKYPNFKFFSPDYDF